MALAGSASPVIPEGHPRIAQPALDQALAAKLALLRQAGIDAHMVTQFVFDAAPVLDWLADVARARRVVAGADWPCRARGIATLARYAVRCGIGHSINGAGASPNVNRAAGHGIRAGNGAARARGGGLARTGVNGIHLFSFGGLTADGAVAAGGDGGRFTIERDGARVHRDGMNTRFSGCSFVGREG